MQSVLFNPTSLDGIEIQNICIEIEKIKSEVDKRPLYEKIAEILRRQLSLFPKDQPITWKEMIELYHSKRLVDTNDLHHLNEHCQRDVHFINGTLASIKREIHQLAKTIQDKFYAVIYHTNEQRKIITYDEYYLLMEKVGSTIQYYYESEEY